MGPLVPNEIIGSGWDFLIAFVIGISFGFILERAGFSSSRKLAGVFYGYDAVVLKVFFTAAITAMLGLLYFSLFDWINLDLVYVNPTYLGSAVVGGVIMGLGFIIGGYCPGTSVCAASIGKVDAMIFIGGAFIGSFIFAELYPLIKPFFMSGFMGYIKISDFFGISGGVFALMVIIAAAMMFWGAEWAEKQFPREEY